MSPLFFVASSLAYETVTVMDVSGSGVANDQRRSRQGRSGVDSIDICQRYVFPILGSIFFLFSYCSLFFLVIYYCSFVRFILLLCAGHGSLLLPTGATYASCHQFRMKISNRCFFQCFSHHWCGTDGTGKRRKKKKKISETGVPSSYSCMEMKDTSGGKGLNMHNMAGGSMRRLQRKMGGRKWSHSWFVAHRLKYKAYSLKSSSLNLINPRHRMKRVRATHSLDFEIRGYVEWK